ncbi:MAG TPA: hypothetical protein VGM32_13335 [Rhodopila sp.]|jgi:hypothetical protein
MAKKVLILRWSGSAYDSLGGLLELTAQEFAALGFDVTLFSADGPDWPQRLVQLLNHGGIAFALTMSGIGTDIAVNGKLAWEAAKVPLFNWSCDHPCYFPTRHAIRNPYLLHGYVFPDHARYQIRHLNPNGAAFAVHLGVPPRSLFPHAPLPPTSRNGRIMFAKSGADTNKIEATWRGYVPDLRHIAFAAAEELFARSTADFLPTLQGIAEARGLFLDGNNRLAMLLIREIDAYIRFKRANLVMKAALRFPVDVFGSGWDHIDWDGATATFHGSVTWRGMLDRLPHYLGCLSTNPLIEESVHDRVFFALAAGVVPITDANTFTQAHMPGLHTFSFSRERIEQAIEAPLAAQAIAIAQVEATWDAIAARFGIRRSAQQIIELVGLHALNAPAGA